MVNIITFITSGNCPAGWTEDTAFIGAIPAFDSIEANARAVGGKTASTHNHPIGGACGGWDGGLRYFSWSGRYYGGETITLTPPYVKVRFCRKDISTSNYKYPPNSMIMFDGACPPGWIKISTYDNKQPRGATTSLGTTGSTAANHSHSLVYGVTYFTNVCYYLYSSPCTGIGANDFLASTDMYNYVKVVLCKKQ